MKVLIFVILLSTLNFIKFAKSLNLTYILKQRHDHFEPNCIAEEDQLDSPIGWIYPLPASKDDIPQTSEKTPPKKKSAPHSLIFSHQIRATCEQRLLLHFRRRKFVLAHVALGRGEVEPQDGLCSDSGHQMGRWCRRKRLIPRICTLYF